MAPKSTEEARIACTSPEHLKQEIETLIDALAPVETEDTWEKLERAIIRFAAVTRGGGYKFPAVYVEGVGRKGAGPKLVDCMLSDRGRLSGVATDLLTTMAPRLSSNFAPLTPIYLPIIIKLLGRPNKVYLKRADKCMTVIVAHCPSPNILGMLRLGIEDKSEPCRRACGGAFEKATDDWEKETVGSKGIVEIETSLRKMATDRDAEVRKIGKRVWEIYSAKWPERVDDFTAPLTPTIRRYLDITQNQNRPAKRPPAPVARPAIAAPRPIGISKAPSIANLHPITARVITPVEADPFDQAFTRPVLSSSMSSGMTRMPSSMSMATFPGPSALNRTASSATRPDLSKLMDGPTRPILSHLASSSTSASSAAPTRRIVSGGPVRPIRPGAPGMVRGMTDGRAGASPAVSSLGKAVRPARVISSSVLGQSLTPWMDGVDEEVAVMKKEEPVIRRRVVSAASGLEGGRTELMARIERMKSETAGDTSEGKHPEPKRAVVEPAVEIPQPTVTVPPPITLEVPAALAVPAITVPVVVVPAHVAPASVVPAPVVPAAVVPAPKVSTMAPPKKDVGKGKGREAFKPSSSHAIAIKAKIAPTMVKKPMQMSASSAAAPAAPARTALPLPSQPMAISRKASTLVPSSAGLHPRPKLPMKMSSPVKPVAPATARVPRVKTKPPVPQLSGVKRAQIDRSVSGSSTASPTKMRTSQIASEEDTISASTQEDTITIPPSQENFPSADALANGARTVPPPSDTASPLVESQSVGRTLSASETVKPNIFAALISEVVAAPATAGLTGQLLHAADIPLPPSPVEDDFPIDHESTLHKKPSKAFSVAASSSNETASVSSDAGMEEEHAQSGAESEDPMNGISVKSPSKRGQPVMNALLQNSLARSQLKMAMARAELGDGGDVASRREEVDLMEFSDGSQAGSSFRSAAPLIDLADSARFEPAENIIAEGSSKPSHTSPRIAATMALLAAKSVNKSVPPMTTPLKFEPGMSKSERLDELRKERGFTPSSRSEGQKERNGSTTPMSTPPRSKSVADRKAFVGTPLRGL